MTSNPNARFEGAVLARLEGIEERQEEILRHVRDIDSRCLTGHAAFASLKGEVQAVREKTDFNARVIWGAVVWLIATALGALAALLKKMDI